jgi:hypothetical protein
MGNPTTRETKPNGLVPEPSAAAEAAAWAAGSGTTSCTLTVTGSTIMNNTATGGRAGSGGSSGQGIGGGVYFTTGGIVCLDLFTSLDLDGNTSSTSNDVFGVFTIC